MATRHTPETITEIKVLLGLKYSYSLIIDHFKAKNIKVVKSTISKIKNKSENNQNLANKVETRGRKTMLSKQQITRLKKMAENPNPRTQKSMAKSLNISQQVVSYQINKVLDKKLTKKPKGQELSEKTIQKRYRRSWPLYLKLRGQRWTKLVTSDEAWFYLDSTSRKTKLQYLSRGQKRTSLETFTSKSHPKGVLVWVGISANGCTQARFVERGAKVNSDYYIKNVLKPFLTRDIPKLYPNGDYLFHQDSAPSHVSKKTLNYLRSMNVPFITPEQWLPNSPDVAPLDYFFWGYLKNRI
jgi:transposase